MKMMAFMRITLPTGLSLRFGMVTGLLAGWVTVGSTLEGETRLESQVLAGGGGYATGGAHALHGTLGQPAAGFSSTGVAAVKSGFWHVGLTVIVDADGDFYDWMESLPTDQKPPPDQRDPLDIAAGDGMTNLLKYALGLFPMTPSADAAPRGVLQDGYWGVQLDRSSDASVELQIEASEDLSLWEVVSHSESLIDPDIGQNRERVILLTEIDLAEYRRYFFRVRVIME